MLSDILFISNKKFSPNGENVNSNISKIYLHCYSSLIKLHLGKKIDKFDLNNLEINCENKYSKFHLASLLLDVGFDINFILKKLQINNEDITNSLIQYDLSNLWFTSNIHMGALALLSKIDNNNQKKNAIKMINNLDKINFTSDKWKYKGSINRVAAFYHYIPFIDNNNLNISSKTLNLLFNDLQKIQNDLGSFCYPNGFSCIELDSVVTLAFLKKRGFKVDSLLEKKMFNAQFTLSEFGWPLYPKGENEYNSLISISKNIFKIHIQDYLWNLKKILFDINKKQFDNSNIELVSKSTDITLMSNYFGLVTYIQLLKTLNINVLKDYKLIKSTGLSYVI